jgi:hypothetical protein
VDDGGELAGVEAIGEIGVEMPAQAMPTSASLG